MIGARASQINVMFMLKPKITQWPDAPVPASCESPILHVNGRELFISYLIAPVALQTEDQDECGVVKFGGVSVFTYGYPNDEALPGHPLIGFGLEYYSFNVIENSPRIEEMKKQNAVRFPDSGWLWDKRKHFIVTFQDDTLEVVCSEISFLGRVATDDRRKALEYYVGK
ncbi:hypothetical protein [Undibacterium sp.]|uniref:hypothetical protein n=1 Tax=Undibacterium sp. TaxID=1914977 RepID=UPI0037504C53